MDDDLSLYAAGGNKILKHMERLTAKQEKVADQQQEMIDEKVREKAQSVSTIKRIATEQGGKPLTTTNIASALSSIATTVTNRINQMSVNTTKQFLPIDSQLKQVNDLLSSNREGDIDKGFEMIDRLQSRLGIDLGKYSKEIGDAVQKLYDMNRQRKEDKAEANRIQKEKTEELTIERDILREQGINTYVNEKTLKLEIRSKKEEKAEMKRLQKEEQRLQDEQKRILGETKELKRLDPNDAKRQDKEMRILADSDNLFRDRKKFEEDKEKANVKPGQRMSGMIDQTVGEAFRQIKSLGPEIVQLGGDLLKGFGKLAGVVGKVALGFLALLKPLIPFVLIAVAIGVVLFALYKIVKTVIDLISNAINYVKDKLSFIFGDDKKAKTDQQTGQGKSQSLDETGSYGFDAVEGQEGTDVGPSPREFQKKAGVEFYGNRMPPEEQSKTMRELYPQDKILPVGSDTSIIKSPEEKRAEMRARGQIPRGELNKMSIENQAMNQSKPTNNTVIAPNVSNSNVNASNTQVSSMEPTNFDRSFINLNTVPV